MQKIELFKKEDFYQAFGSIDRCDTQYAAHRANEILNKHIESLPMVYFKYLGGVPFNIGPDLNKEDDTHSAYLINIQEIEKKQCEHRPRIIEISPDMSMSKMECQHCGIEIEPVAWKVKS